MKTMARLAALTLLSLCVTSSALVRKSNKMLKPGDIAGLSASVAESDVEAQAEGQDALGVEADTPALWSKAEEVRVGALKTVDAKEMSELGVNEREVERGGMFFNTDCKMKVDTAKKEIILITPDGEMTATKEGIISNGINIGDAPKDPLICHAIDTDATDKSLAIFTQTTGAKYLFEDKEGQWTSFANQHCWAKQQKKHQFLWFGSVTHTAAAFLNNRSHDALPCGEKAFPSNHYFRALALRAILRENPQVSFIMNMDLDAWFPASHWNEDLQTALFSDQNADIVAGAPSYKVLVNAAILGFKNSQFSHNFLGNWFKHRCGFKDQLSLWNNLLIVFKKQDPKFDWDKQKMLTYDKAKEYVPKLIAQHFPQSKGLLSKPPQVHKAIHLPHLLIHPNEGQYAMRYANANGYPWTCHLKKDKHERGHGCDVHRDQCKLEDQCHCS